MAYLNFSDLSGRLGAPSAWVARSAPASSGLSGLEWSVVALAQRDSLATLNQPGRMAIALGRMFGGERPNPRLADRRLEALRRISVLLWRRGEAPAAEIASFHAAGFTAGHYQTLLASISRGRAALHRKH